jgi:uncharacterized protein YutE (UPF0331/DUF86 family)
MALTKKEKQALIVAINFMIDMGEHFVPLVKNGTAEENSKLWKEAKILYKDLDARIKKTL